jgi:hypothetical protein
MAGLLAPQIKFRYTDDNGNPLNAGKVYTYVSGTSTLLVTYSDAALTVPNTNPVVLNARGEAMIYLAPGKQYRFTVKTAAGATIQTTDGIIGASPAGSSEWLDIKNFGATGDGTTDDTAAIQAALTAATTAPRRTLFVPAGTYKMTAGVTINGRIDIVGDGMADAAFNYTPTTGKAFTWTADGSYSSISKIKLYNNGNARVLGDTATGIQTYQGAACVLYNFDQVFIEGFALWGITLNDSFNCSFVNCRIRNNGVRASLAGLGVDGQGGGMLLQRITFSGSASTGNDYSNSYITGNNIGISVLKSGTNQKCFNTRFDNCIFEENYAGLDLQSIVSASKGRYQFLNTCYFEANLFAGALMDEGTSIACYQNNTTAGTNIPPSVSYDGADGINWAGRYVEDRPSRFRIGNFGNAPYDRSQSTIFSVDKNETTSFIAQAMFNQSGGISLTPGAGTATSNIVTLWAGNGNPEGAITANSASLFLRKDGTAINNILYVKTQDSNTAGWVSIGAQYGPTSSRPVADATNKGTAYYDTDILRVVTSNGAGIWREYNGLSLVTGPYASLPVGITGASYYATDTFTTLLYDGVRWRKTYDIPEFVSVTNGGTTTVAKRGGDIVGTTTGAAVATHTLVLPSGTDAVSGDAVRFTVSNGVTALTVSTGAGTIVNAPTTLAAGTTVEFIYNDSSTTWYKR